MNRRNFISGVLAAAAGFAILPAATTYGRIWKPAKELWIPNPEWETAEYELAIIPNGNYFVWLNRANQTYQTFLHPIVELTDPVRYKNEHGVWHRIPTHVSSTT